MLACALGNSVALGFRKLKADTGNDLADVQRLSEVIANPKLQASNLALDRTVTRQEHYGDVGPPRVLSYALDELETVDLWQPGIRQDQVWLVGAKDLESLAHMRAAGDVVPRSAQAYLQHTKGAFIGIYDQQALLRHSPYPEQLGHSVGSVALICQAPVDGKQNRRVR